MLSRKKIAALFLLASTGAALPGDLTGHASIFDGDTLEIHGARIRLWGIDAPESTQLCRGEDSLQYRCGAKAANDLAAFITQRPLAGSKAAKVWSRTPYSSSGLVPKES
jgi:endonuclease YncB( thermonuclease family)